MLSMLVILILKYSGLFHYLKCFRVPFNLSEKMDQNLLNFWKNYEDIIDWGYRVSGVRGTDGSRSSAPINTETLVCFY